MNVAVHGEGEIAVPCDGLQRLGIHARFVQQGQAAVAEDVGGGVVQIDRLAHVVEHRAVDGHRNGFLHPADDVASLFVRQQQGAEQYRYPE